MDGRESNQHGQAALQEQLSSSSPEIFHAGGAAAAIETANAVRKAIRRTNIFIGEKDATGEIYDSPAR